jgi:hypothetical protein
VVWPDGSGRWYWDGIAVPARIADNRNQLAAESIASVVLERVGWERFLETAGATLVDPDDYGKLWGTEIRLEILGVSVERRRHRKGDD